jgi:hypothetical protein
LLERRWGEVSGKEIVQIFERTAGGKIVLQNRKQHVPYVGKLHIAFVKQHLETVVRKAVHLFLGGGNDFRVTVTGVDNRNAGGKVDVPTSFNVPHLSILFSEDKSGAE